MPLLYIGIDNGISGGIAAIGQCGSIIAMRTMPTRKHGAKNEVDIRELYRWLSDVTGGNLSNGIYCIEEPGGSKSAAAAKSMAGSFHSIRGFFETKFLAFDRVTPQRWQKAMMGKVAKGETKARALDVASELWPNERFLTNSRCKVVNHNLVDAALIAEYLRRHANEFRSIQDHNRQKVLHWLVE